MKLFLFQFKAMFHPETNLNFIKKRKETKVRNEAFYQYELTISHFSIRNDYF